MFGGAFSLLDLKKVGQNFFLINCQFSEMYIQHNCCRGAVAQSVEHPSKVPGHGATQLIRNTTTPQYNVKKVKIDRAC